MDSETSWPRGATLRADDIPAEWLAEFEAAARRPLSTPFCYTFIHTYKPVLDDEPFRAFDTTADYRRWCEENLPDWLGYGRVLVPAGRGDPRRFRPSWRALPVRQVRRDSARLPRHHAGRRSLRRKEPRQRPGPRRRSARARAPPRRRASGTDRARQGLRAAQDRPVRPRPHLRTRRHRALRGRLAAADRGRRLPRLPPRRHHCQQASERPREGPRISASAAVVPRVLASTSGPVATIKAAKAGRSDLGHILSHPRGRISPQRSYPKGWPLPCLQGRVANHL